MKLLSIISSMNPSMGGIAQGIRNNTPYWGQNGIISSIVTTDDPNEAFVKQDNIIALGPCSKRWGYSPKLGEWLQEHLSSYDVVVVHGLWLYNNYSVYKAIKALKKSGEPVPKLYVMPHGMLDPYFQKAKQRILKAIRNIVYWHLIEKNLIKIADAVLFTCEEEMELAATTFSDYKPKRTYNIGFGINTPPQYLQQQQLAFEAKCPELRNKYPESGNRPYVLFLGRVHPKKGIDLLIDAYLTIKQKFWSESKNLPTLVIAGPSEDAAYSQKLIARVENDPLLQGNIVFVGMLHGDAKWGALYGSQAFILPSHQENFGIAVVEAMACRKPVLITNKVNIWREIEMGNAGIIENDDLEGTIHLLTKWMSLSIDEKQEMGKNAYDTYQEKFTAKNTTQQFIDILKDRPGRNNLSVSHKIVEDNYLYQVN